MAPTQPLHLHRNALVSDVQSCVLDKSLPFPQAMLEDIRSVLAKAFDQSVAADSLLLDIPKYPKLSENEDSGCLHKMRLNATQRFTAITKQETATHHVENAMNSEGKYLCGPETKANSSVAKTVKRNGTSGFCKNWEHICTNEREKKKSTDRERRNVATKVPTCGVFANITARGKARLCIQQFLNSYIVTQKGRAPTRAHTK